MARSENDKKAFALLSLFSKRYKTLYGQTLTINKYQAKWGMLSLVEDYGADTVDSVMEYFFSLSVSDSHSLKGFYNNFDKFANRMQEDAKDEKIRAEQHRITMQLREEYLNGLQRGS